MKSEQFLTQKLSSLQNEFELAGIKAYDSEQLQGKKKKQLTNAAKVIGAGINQNLITAVLDSTIFGSGKEGAVFTGKWCMIRGTFGDPSGKIDLARLQSTDYVINTSTNDKGKEVKEYRLEWKYQDDDEEAEAHYLSTSTKTDGDVLACVDKVLNDFNENADSENIQETDHGQTLTDLGEDAVFQYLKIIYLYLVGPENNFGDHELRNYTMLQSQLNVSSEMDQRLRVYRMGSEHETLETQVEALKTFIPEGSQPTIFQSLVNDILSTFSDDDLAGWEEEPKLATVLQVTNVSSDQAKFFARNQQLTRRQLNEKLTDNEVKELTKKLAASGASVGASLLALAVTGASVGAFGEAGIGTLAFMTMSTGGLGLAVVGIGAASVAAYKGVEYLTNSQKSKYAYRNELLQAEVIKLSNSQQIIMKDINYLTDKIADEMSKNESNEVKLERAERWIASVRNRSKVGTKMDQERISANREQLISEIPVQIDREKLHDLVQSHTFGNEIETQILGLYDDEDNLQANLSVRSLSMLLNRLNSIEYTKAVTMANTKVAGKKVKGMANTFMKRYTDDKSEQQDDESEQQPE
ncbi:hypothetical protein [Lactiplantibacillus paraxiangfangensis]|uniref:hypothetical protein n=1 Tax=Lactiplantibacillus paraxiangfangensis TaxID=3076224 RepID=UPI0030C6A360